MQQFTPGSAKELADVLGSAAAKAETIQIVGNSSKRLMGGPITPAQCAINTSRLRRVLRYERDDLTISVEAGMPFAELQSILRENRQMIALDPPFQPEATVGGVLATNGSGPMRRGYGTARDLVIGLTFATLEGKLVQTGGMVVKNVAGLDLGKIMIGSFGTLGVVTSANFRVHSRPPETRTFLLIFKDVDAAIQKRNDMLGSVLQPTAMDLISPPAAARLGHDGYLLAIQAGGSASALKRFSQHLIGSVELAGSNEEEFWSRVREFAPEFIARQPNGIVLRISSTLSGINALLKSVTGPCISRAGSGVSYVCLTNWQSAIPLWQTSQENGWSLAVELASDEIRSNKQLWLPSPDEARRNGFGMMEKVKRMFDPAHLLNRSRLYGRI
jgi:glycolate oxidase FAD binding subunit